MSRRLFATIAVFAALAAWSCTKRNPGYCGDDRVCIDPARPYCDLNGAFGSNNACIANPFGQCEVTANTCAIDSPICDPQTGGCRPCGTGPSLNGDGECAAIDLATPACAPDGTCVQCTDSADCPNDSPICTADYTCQSCGPLNDDSESCAMRSSETPFCTPSGRCSACLTQLDCSTTEPFCNLETGGCEPCTRSSQCESDVCDLEDRRCVAEEDIAYVTNLVPIQPGQTGSKSDPFATIEQAEESGRMYVKIFSGSYEAGVSGVKQVVGPAVFDLPNGASPAFSTDSGLLILENIEIINSQDQDPSVACEDASLLLVNVEHSAAGANGVSTQGCEVTVRDSTLGLGVVALSSSTVRVEDSDLGQVLFVNGEATLANVAVDELLADAAVECDACVIRERVGATGPRFSFVNSVMLNAEEFELTPTSLDATISFSTFYNLTGGFTCSGVVNVENSIVWNATTSAQCNFRYSIVDGGADGPGNLDANPEFVNEFAGDFHLQSGSPAIDAADPEATLATDIDGDARPQGSRHDIGADEFTGN